MEWTDIAISNERGDVVEFQSVGRDITEKLKTLNELIIAKEKAEESDRLKTAFINNISHEIRTPLNGILGFGQFLAESELSAEKRSEFFEHIEKSSKRLMDTVTDYMDMAMLVSNTMKVNKKEFTLEPVFETITVKTKQLCLNKRIDFKVEIPIESAGLTVNSDPEFMQKIFDKLIENAVKFTKEGSIICGYKIKPEHIEFFVKDTGRGIGDDMQHFIFEMFRQEDSSMTRGYEGSGLGLTIAKGLVTLLGGEINVASEKGKGSKFTFTIPFNNPEKSISADETKTTKPKSNEKPLILIAEDDDLNFLYLDTLLDSKGYNKIHAVNGAEAVDFCRQNPDISIVLMDIKMPVMNGLEATKSIREFRPELPIIATTADSQTGEEHRFLKAGCDDYIAKPIKKEKILSLIRKYVDRI
jgi:signal transduction histidine kinase/CheY-like chemotaxis protein